MYYLEDNTVGHLASYSLEYGIRSGDCGTGATTIICSDPLLVNEPLQGASLPESTFDTLNFHPSSSSPARGAGVGMSGLTKDYYGVNRPPAPTSGAVEP
jgi:hypothetical protein